MSRVFPLAGNQKLAVEPADSVWLSASAGTGKTQVLSARVLRLLLEPGVRPEQILCLTFTKAGAAEMATRVNEVLAAWVRMDQFALRQELENIGAAYDPATIARARSLFAAVLDCPGGGLRIDTIHAFAQWLLAAFPEEAGLTPGTRAMEDRDREALARRVLAAELVAWEASDPAAIAALEALSLRLGPDGARKWLMTCAQASGLWEGPGGWQPPMRGRVARLIGLEAEAGEQGLAALCEDGAFDMAALRQCLAVLENWNSTTGREGADAIRVWLALSPLDRARNVEIWSGTVFTKGGFFSPERSGKQLANITKRDPAYPAALDRVSASLDRVIGYASLLQLLETLTPALELGRKFALAWDEAKASEGLVDFDDLIRRAAGLLERSQLAEWIRYKLDRQFDHLLIDEAQDTNTAQWQIINALTGDFFTGIGQAGGRQRTIFVVGDYKQAIFGFQGTSPENFNKAFAYYRDLLAERRRNADALRDPQITARDLINLDLGRSYRTAQDVLTFVDEAIAEIGAEGFGLDSAPPGHVGDAGRPGLVALWHPVMSDGDEDSDSEGARENGAENGAENGGEDAPETRTTAPERVMADRLALQIKQWLNQGFPLMKGEHRNARAGDIMVLVRSRRELAGLIVARLYAAGVPVAGVDRLRLGAPLAVKDLLSALRFAVQPRDDLALACLLTSPLIGWSQEQLLAHGHRPKGTGLWRHLRDSGHVEAQAAVADLLALLARADFEPPQALLHWILVGPWQGRAKLLARLGREAEDPISELLGAALQFASTNTPSLQGFLRWFDSGTGELKREPEGSGDVVRVMTVHGSKGLQAPIVILADACADPDRKLMSGLTLIEELPGQARGCQVPLLPLRKEERAGRIAQAAEEQAKAEREEHWRLLYVAMTRAEEALFIGGALGRNKAVPPPQSWHARLAPLFPDAADDAIWGSRAERGARGAEVPARSQAEFSLPVLPVWARRIVSEEPRPPRPLAPSASAEDSGADPPLPVQHDPLHQDRAQAALAARRGVLIHALLERLPDAPADLRGTAGRAWLARQAPDFSPALREDMLGSALAVLAEPRFAALFGPAALAEVPLVATVGEQVIAGTVDRLLIEDDRILVADFKTARRPPQTLAQVPATTLAQMAAYVAALGVIFPGRRIEAAVLYTQVPQLIVVPPEVLAVHMPTASRTPQSAAQKPDLTQAQ